MVRHWHLKNNRFGWQKLSGLTRQRKSVRSENDGKEGRRATGWRQENKHRERLANARNKKTPKRVLDWLREPDLNRRPSGYEPDELPGCSIPRPNYCCRFRHDRFTAFSPERKWLREPDLNRRPSGYEPDELPGCSIPRPNDCRFHHDSLLLFSEENWLREPDLNRRPSGYEPDELPGCSIPRPWMRTIR